jgi:hypothetical protein
VSDEEAHKALEDCAEDAAADARDAQQPTTVEPAVPLVHSFETTVDPLIDRLGDRFRAWRAARKRRSR